MKTSNGLKIIILAAGQSPEIDGANKILLEDPKTGKKILDNYLEMFKEDEITIVVGYDSVNIIMQYPDFNYVYNPDWRVTGNSYSLGLALSDQPCIVLSADFFMDKEIISKLKKDKENVIVVKNTVNRSLQALNCSLDNNNKVLSIRQGPVKNNEPEVMGIYKFSSKKVIRKLKNNCLQHPNLSVGQNIPLDIENIYAINVDQYDLYEINTPLDYINFIKK